MRYRIEYATFVGGMELDRAREIIPSADGSVLIAGQTSSANLPTTPGAIQPRYAGDDAGVGDADRHGGDCFLARLSADGKRLLAATYFGGSRRERGVHGMKLCSDGSVVITGSTRSPDLPTTAGCFQPFFRGGEMDAFVTRLSADLSSVVWSTYLGGSGSDGSGGGLTLDADDCVYVFGTTTSPDYPTTLGAHRTAARGSRDAFVTKLGADGGGMIWSTRFGGSGHDYALGGRLDADGSVRFAGHTNSRDLEGAAGRAQSHLRGADDAYVARLSADGRRVLFSTYIGGKQGEFATRRPYLFTDGSLLVAGVTHSADFPVTSDAHQRTLRGSSDAFLTRVSADGRSLLFSTLIGGFGEDAVTMSVVAPDGTIVIVGETSSHDLPVTRGALQRGYGGGTSDGWLAILSPNGAEILYCTYLGGNREDSVHSVALGREGELYLTGGTASWDFPVTPGSFQPRYGGGAADAFVIKLVPAGQVGRAHEAKAPA